MPDASGRFKGISTQGIKNAWLDSLERKPYAGPVEDRLTRAEVRDEIDRAARDQLGMTGDEFFEQWRAGNLDEFEPKIARLAVLARLLTD